MSFHDSFLSRPTIGFFAKNDWWFIPFVPFVQRCDKSIRLVIALFIRSFNMQGVLAKDVCLSSTRVVARMAEMVSHQLSKRQFKENSFIVEPCAGDGRLAKALQSKICGESESCTVLMFDIDPLVSDVERLDIFSCHERVQSLQKSSSSSSEERTTIVLCNPPFNRDDCERICSECFQIPGSMVVGLVLPGRYCDVMKLDDIIPLDFRVEVMEVLPSEDFFQPRLDKSAKELTIVLVVAVRISYVRVKLSRLAHPIPKGGRFQYVDGDDWDLAVHLGPHRHVGIVRLPTEQLDDINGEWAKIKFCCSSSSSSSSAAATATMVEMVAYHLKYVSARSWWPRISTTKLFKLPKSILSGLINDVLERSDSFIVGDGVTSIVNALSRFLDDQSATVVEESISQGRIGNLIDGLIEFLSDEAKRDVFDKLKSIVSTMEIVSSPRVAPAEDLASEFIEPLEDSVILFDDEAAPEQQQQQQQKQKRQSDNGDDIIEVLEDTTVQALSDDPEEEALPKKQKRHQVAQGSSSTNLKDLLVKCQQRFQNRTNLASFEKMHEDLNQLSEIMDQVSSVVQNNEEEHFQKVAVSAMRGEKLVRVLNKRDKKFRDELSFYFTLVSGRSFWIMSRLLKQPYRQIKTLLNVTDKTIQRYIALYELVSQHQLLRYAWPFTNIVNWKGGKEELLKEIAESGLDFGGHAPTETLALLSGQEAHVMSSSFIRGDLVLHYSSRNDDVERTLRKRSRNENDE